MSMIERDAKKAGFTVEFDWREAGDKKQSFVFKTPKGRFVYEVFGSYAAECWLRGAEAANKKNRKGV
jgi:hypothetical protein